MASTALEAASSGQPRGSKRTASGSPEREEQAARPAKAVKNGDALDAAMKGQENAVEQMQRRAFQVLSWNVDGLDERMATERAAAAAKECLANGKGVGTPLAPDVVFLQEVTQTTLPIFASVFVEHGYTFDGWPEGNYFAMAFVKKEGGLENPHITRQNFARSNLGAGSDMDRDLIKVMGNFNGRSVLCMTSHLESCQEGAAKRRRQFSEALGALTAHEGGPGIFVGDTNLRVAEVKAEPLVRSVRDVWELAGASDATKCTFDTSENHNSPMHDQRIFIKARYDRAYVNLEGAHGPISFGLIGKERTVSGYHPSDHYGVVCTFEW